MADRIMNDTCKRKCDIDGLVQNSSISSALALELM